MRRLGTVRIETERLCLRRYESGDARAIFEEWASDPKVSKFWTWTPHESLEDTLGILAKWVAESDRPDVYHWAIVLRESARPIGYIYLSDIHDADLCVSAHYAIGSRYWNRGIATEALRAVIGFAFDSLGAAEVRSWHHAGNSASGRVMRKAGMAFVKREAKVYPECERINGEYWVYAIRA